MEVAFLLRLTGRRAPEPLRSHAGMLRPEAIAMLGMLNDLYLREITDFVRWHRELRWTSRAIGVAPKAISHRRSTRGTLTLSPTRRV
jgi:hypothetical protein